jgi:hypothetical protein
MGLFDNVSRKKKEKKQEEKIHEENEQDSLDQDVTMADIAVESEDDQVSAFDQFVSSYGELTGVKKKEPAGRKSSEEAAEEEPEKERSFVFGVLTVSKSAEDGSSVVLVKLRGSVRVGDTVFISNPGDDADRENRSKILSISDDNGTAMKEADQNGYYSLRLERGEILPLRPATVGFSRGVSKKDIRDVYEHRLGTVYVQEKDLNLSDEELGALSVTDLQEIWRMYVWYHTSVVKDENEEQRAENQDRLDRLVEYLCSRVLRCDAIYCVFDRRTGAPHLYSRTQIGQDGTRMAEPPAIRICTEASRELIHMEEDPELELVRIEGGKVNNGILNFLGDTFYLNGVCSVQVISESTAADRSAFVAPADYSNVPEKDIPVTNPDLMRWILLMGQMNDIEGEKKRTDFRVYIDFEAGEMLKARFLVPVRKKDDGTDEIPEQPGKNGRGAIPVFTDYIRFREEFDESWELAAVRVSDLIGQGDLIINGGGKPGAGCYLSEETYARMRRDFGGPEEENSGKDADRAAADRTDAESASDAPGGTETAGDVTGKTEAAASTPDETETAGDVTGEAEAAASAPGETKTADDEHTVTDKEKVSAGEDETAAEKEAAADEESAAKGEEAAAAGEEATADEEHDVAGEDDTAAGKETAPDKKHAAEDAE